MSGKFLHWTPRLLGILLILFISMFALDIFSEGFTGWQIIIGLIMHLIPSFILLAALLVAWRWPGVGGLVFLGAVVFFVFRYGGPANWRDTVFFTAPMLVIAVLFLLDWGVRRSQKPAA